MVALEAEAPCSVAAGTRRRGEDGHEILLGVPVAWRPFQLAEDRLQPDDVPGLAVAFLAKGQPEQIEGCGALRRRHLRQGDALAPARRVVPVGPLGVIEGKGCRGALLR